MAKIELPVVKEGSEPGLGRRKVLQGLLTGVGTGLAIPGLAAEHPVHAHLAEAHAVEAQAKAAAAPATQKPVFLGDHEYATLTSLAEQILPGSGRLKVDRFVDLLLSVDTQENQKRFLSALGAMDAECRERFQKPWKGLTASQQIEVLTTASTMSPGGDRPRRGPGGGGGAGNLRDHFDHIKGWVSGAYYSTEEGMRELGYTGNQFFPEFPGCPHPDRHA